MKILFCHDGPLYKNELNEYYSVGFNDTLFNRYSLLSNDITVAMRVYFNKNDNIQSSQLLSKKYKVIECFNICSLNGFIFDRKKCKKLIDEQMYKADFAIIRLPSFIGNIAISCAQKYKKPFIVELVGCPWDSLWNHGIIGKILAPYLFFTTKREIKESKYVVYVTNNFLQKRYPNDKFNIGCSDVDLSRNTEFGLNTRQLNKNQKLIIGTLGIIDVPYKGQEYVIKAISQLKKEGYNLEYQIAGPGNKSRLQKIAKRYGVIDDVIFLGSIPHDDIYKWLGKLTFYIQPSMTEGMPRALLEAMSVGCVCIGSDAGGIPELLDRKMVFKKGRYQEIAKIINLIDIREYNSQRKKNLEKIKEFNYSFLQSKREKFYKKFIANEFNGRK